MSRKKPVLLLKLSRVQILCPNGVSVLSCDLNLTAQRCYGLGPRPLAVMPGSDRLQLLFMVCNLHTSNPVCVLQGIRVVYKSIPVPFQRVEDSSVSSVTPARYYKCRPPSRGLVLPEALL